MPRGVRHHWRGTLQAHRAGNPIHKFYAFITIPSGPLTTTTLFRGFRFTLFQLSQPLNIFSLGIRKIIMAVIFSSLTRFFFSSFNLFSASFAFFSFCFRLSIAPRKAQPYPWIRIHSFRLKMSGQLLISHSDSEYPYQDSEPDPATRSHIHEAGYKSQNHLYLPLPLLPFIGFLNSSPCTGDRLLCRCNATV